MLVVRNGYEPDIPEPGDTGTGDGTSTGGVDDLLTERVCLAQTWNMIPVLAGMALLAGIAGKRKRRQAMEKQAVKIAGMILAVLIVAADACAGRGIDRARAEEVVADDDLAALLLAGVLDAHVWAEVIAELVVFQDETSIVAYHGRPVAGALAPTTVMDLVVANDDVVDAAWAVAVQGDDLALVHVRAAAPEIAILQDDVVAADHHLTVGLQSGYDDV